MSFRLHLTFAPPDTDFNEPEPDHQPTMSPPKWPKIDGLAYGADYNPEQWDRTVWEEDAKLMKEAGVNVVSVGIFSWALLQPTEDTWDFEWMDAVFDLMHQNGVSIDLGTATASPPPWLSMKHPEILPITEEGEVINQGGRQHWRATSPVFRKYAYALVTKLAERYGKHPALAAWHVNNELGCHNHFDYSDDAARAFRTWLQKRYGSVDKLNFAWGTAFWSQHYAHFDEVLPPRMASTFCNPGQQLDFKRFSSDALLDYYNGEQDILHRITPGIPVTTNFMLAGSKDKHYDSWARDVDFVSTDHYVTNGRDELSFSASFTSGVARFHPWWLMEHSTSAVNWQRINHPKRPGELARDSLSHVAHGADAVCYFQWRASKAGAEKYHSSMVPHGGRDTRLFRDVIKLGDHLKALAPIKGSMKEQAPIAILLDYESWWVSELDSHPSNVLEYYAIVYDWYRACLNAGIRADVVPVAADWSNYAMVVGPVLHVVPDHLQESVKSYIEKGGHFVTTFFSGIVDENDHIRLGGYPGAFRDLLGIRIEEFGPLQDDVRAKLDDGTEGSLWADPVEVTDKEVHVIRKYANGDYPGCPAVTRRKVGAGSAAYIATRLDVAGLEKVLGELVHGTGIKSDLPDALRGKVEQVFRKDGKTRWEFLINRTDEELSLGYHKGEVVVSTGPADKGKLSPRGVVVIKQ